SNMHEAVAQKKALDSWNHLTCVFSTMDSSLSAQQDGVCIHRHTQTDKQIDIHTHTHTHTHTHATSLFLSSFMTLWVPAGDISSSGYNLAHLHTGSKTRSEEHTSEL